MAGARLSFNRGNYTGTNVQRPPETYVLDRDPTPYDNQGYALLDEWLNETNENIWILVSLKGTSVSRGPLATWIQLGSSTGPAQTLTGNTGGAVFPSGTPPNINIVGDGTTATVVGNPGTNTLTISSLSSGGTVTSITAGTGLTGGTITATGTIALAVPVSIADGGTNATSMTNTDGVVYYDGTRLVTTAVGTATYVLTSNGTGVAPTFQVAPSNSITITGDSGGGLMSSSFTFTGASTGLTFAGAGTTLTLGGTLAIANGGTNATSMAHTDGVVYYDGTRLVTTTVGTAGQILTSNGAGMAPTFQTGGSSTITITGDSGGGLTGSSFTFTGGSTGLTFAGASTTETLGGTLVVSHGGTGATTLTGVLIGNGTSAVTGNAVTNHSVIVGGASNALTSLTVGTNGQVLVGSSAANPVFATLTSSDSSIAFTTGAGSLSLQVAVLTPTTLPAFCATVLNNLTNVTGDGTIYQVVYNNTSSGPGYDQTSSFNTSTGVFTAPVAGIYHFDAQAYITGITSTAWNSMQFSVNSSIVSNIPGFLINPGKAFDSSNRIGVTASGDIKLTQGATVWVDLLVGGSTKTIGVQANSQFTGHLVR